MLDEKLQDVIEEALCDWDDNNTNGQIANIENFKKAGVLTMNKGVVISLVDGSEFQVTIVQSR